MSLNKTLMRGSSVVRACRSALPLGAFLALATLAIVLAAQAQIACTRQISLGMAMREMPGMDTSATAIPGAGSILLCPVVLALTAATALLTLNAGISLLLDPERATASRSLAGFVVRLPFATTCAGIFTLGAGGVGSMMAIDGNVPSGIGGWLSVLGIVLATAVAAAIIAVGLGCCVIALMRRIALRLERKTFIARRAFMAYVGSRDRVCFVRDSIPLLAACNGLRAPPFAR